MLPANIREHHPQRFERIKYLAPNSVTMIQRKQTLFLLFAALSLILAFFIPYGIQTNVDLTTGVASETDLNAQSNYLLMALIALAVIFNFFIIFQYQNRKIQMRLCLLAILITLSLTAFQWIDASRAPAGHRFVAGILGSKAYFGIFIPLISVVFLFLAYNGIRNDDKLIRDADRLR